ncbi:BapA/Bap/LapF family large adhesin [Psychrobacter sp. Pi2-52]|uniref:BapA/Bap/LapF family large adhesin n=1 Tax=Psychrobacter sp. Pi2-52 TaxID=2774133 RepID=UPI00191A6D5F|nr:BapA/Bap/LapF family large adhesin [Psychrobacter sp. Pi2-52]
MNTIIVKVNNKVETVAEHTVVLKNETPTVIKAVNRTNYELLDTTVNRAPNNVVTKRVDKNLHISFENDGQGPDLIIEGFYDNADSALIGMAEDGSYYYYLPDTGDVADYVTELQMGEAQSQSLAGDTQISPWWVGATEAEGFAALPWLLGLAGVGVAAAALGGGGGDDNDNDSAPVDTTAPDAPSIDAFNGTTVTGNAEPGSRVDILDADDNVIGTATADATTGAYEVTLDTPLADGETINAVATDAAGNTSAESDPINAPDTTAPDAPEIDGFDGTTVVGSAEPGSTVNILDADDTVIGTATADGTTGAYTVVFDPALADGTPITATATDAANNTSDESAVFNADTATDTTAPDAPSIDAFNGTTVTGNAEPGSRVDILDADDNVIGTATADATTGAYEVTLDTPLADGETINAVATDAAGNTSAESDPINAPDTTAPDAPSIVIGNGDALITADEISDDQVTISIGLPDNASVGDTVTVNGVDQKLTNDDIANSTATVTINAPLEGQSLQVTASITDVAGNESTAVTASATRDTDDAPEAPDSVAIGNGDAFITADEIAGNQVDVIVDLPESSSVGYTVIVNGVEKVLTNDDIEAGNVGVEIPAPEEGAALKVSVKIEDTAGNVSPTVTANAVRDTTAPDTPLAAPVITDNVDGNGDPLDPAETIANQGITNDNTPGVVIPDSELASGTPTLLVDGDPVPATLVGNTLTPNTPLADDTYNISYTITDAAGNVSDASPVTIITVDTNEIIAAADNFVDFQLTATPLETENLTPSDLNKTGFTVVNVGLGPVLNAGVLDDVIANSVVLEVGEDQVREVRVQGAAIGVQVLSTIDLSLYKLNESTNEWELQEVKEDWVVSYLLGGASQETDFSLDEGEWLFVMSSGEGVSALTNYTLNFLSDTVLDYSQATAVSGSITGNVLDDVDASFGYDELPTNATVTSITSVNGEKPLVEGEETIQGEYGTLTIFSDGSYEYEVDSSFRGPYGSEDSFTYTVTSPDGNSSSADLTIQLNILPVDNQVKIDESLVVDITPTEVPDTDFDSIDDVGGFSIANIGILGPILDADALSGSGVMQFTVGDNQVRELTFEGTGFGLLSLAVDYDLIVYRQDESTGNFVQVHLEDDWFRAPVAGGRTSDPLELQLGEGNYRAILIAGDGIGVAGGTVLRVTVDKLFDYNDPSTFTGSIAGKDATDDAGIVLLKVDDQIMELNEPTVVQGEYGSLTINIDGTYDYTVAKPTDAGPDWVPPYGEVESFNLVTKDANGLVAVDTLNIKISTHTAVDDFNNVTVQEQNVVTDIVYEEPDVIFGNYGVSYSQTFTIDEDKVGTSFNIRVEGESNGVFDSDMTISYTLENTTTGETWTSTTNAENDVILDITRNDIPLTAGQYTLLLTSIDGVMEKIDFVANIVDTDSFEVSTIDPTSGFLLDNDVGSNNISELKVGGKSVFVNDPNQGAESIDIEGLYGTLTVNKNGSYSYLPNGESFGIERFTYETTSVTGDKETATLELNVGKGITASEFADTAVSSAANDSFVMGTGADTLVFDNLNGTNGGNGNNGVDTWSDFSAQQGDQIDITGLLDGNQTLGNIGNYLKYENGMLMVDRNGNSEFEEMLEVDATDLDDLLGSINWGAEAGGRVNLIGTSGDDVVDIAYNISDVSLINLGDGFDTINLTGSGQTLSLSDIFQTEALDISGSGANTLLVQAADVINSGTTNPIYVRGGSDDTVDLGSNGDDLSDVDGTNSPSAWIDSGVDVTDTNGQVYNVWQLDSNAATQIYIDTDINVI